MKMDISGWRWICGVSWRGFRLVRRQGYWIPMKSAGPLEPILDEAERAMAHELYYLAIMLSLTLPDICSALQEEDGRTTREAYKRWFDINLGSKFETLSADDCYSLRCGVLHQGRMGLMRKGRQFGRVLFSVRDTSGLFDSNRLDDAVQFDTTTFCNVIAEAVREWFQAAQDDPIVVQNLPNLVKYRPQGLAPYMTGIPLIA
jgi:hypothetical protein